MQLQCRSLRSFYNRRKSITAHHSSRWATCPRAPRTARIWLQLYDAKYDLCIKRYRSAKAVFTTGRHGAGPVPPLREVACVMEYPTRARVEQTDNCVGLVPNGVACCIPPGPGCNVASCMRSTSSAVRRMLRVASWPMLRVASAYVARCVGVCCALHRPSSGGLTSLSCHALLSTKEQGLAYSGCSHRGHAAVLRRRPRQVAVHQRSVHVGGPPHQCSPAKAEACARLRKHSKAARRGLGV